MTKQKDDPNQSNTTLDETTQDAVETDSDSRKQKMKLSRRGFIVASTGAAASILTTGNSLAEPQRRSRAGGLRQVAVGKVDSSGESPSFREPEVIHARYVNGESVLEADLNVELADWRFTCGSTETHVQVPIYNQKVPGPTLLAEPGTTLKLTLNNNMPTQSPFTGDTCAHCGDHHSATTPPLANCFMHTNLHTHGLLVSPCSIDKAGNTHCGPICSDQLRVSSDDVLIDVPPQGKNEYCIVLPKFHDSGTYWYHSHLHGASGYQVAGGLAGAIIIEDRPGEELVQQDQDKVFVVQEVVTTQGTNYPGVYLSGPAGASQFFVNGQCTPTLQMWAGQTQRWRLINATGTPRGLMKVWLYKCSDNPTAQCPALSTSIQLKPAGQNPIMYLMAVDGIAFYGFPPMPVEAHIMAAGNRADFLINLPPGKYMLVKDGFPLDATNIWATGSANLGASVNSRQALAYIEVQESKYKKYEEAIPKVIPGRKPFYHAPIADTSYLKKGRQVTFSAVQSGGTGPGGVMQGQFKINGNFYPDNSDIEVDLDTAEELTITNAGGTGAAQLPHPFHIHVNPFQMVRRTIDFEVADVDRKYLPPPFDKPMDPADPCNWMWMDTASMPAPATSMPPVYGTGPGQMKLRTRFLVYPGEFVIHCHMLVHEDVGMMVNVRVKGEGKGPCVKVDDPPPASLACVERTTKPCR
ncbi:MAG: multicopper oxidase domain-containing protein [Blastocatellia bacterium]